MSIIADLAKHYGSDKIFDPNDKEKSRIILEDIVSKINIETNIHMNSEDFQPLWKKLGFETLPNFVAYSHNPFFIKIALKLNLYDLHSTHFFEGKDYIYNGNIYHDNDLCQKNLINFLSFEEEKKIFEWYSEFKENIPIFLASEENLRYKKEYWPKYRILFLSHLRKLFPEFFPSDFDICNFSIGPGWFGLIEKYCYKLYENCKKNNIEYFRFKFTRVYSDLNRFALDRIGGYYSENFSIFYEKLKSESRVICEGCGAKEKQTNKTVCINCEYKL